MAPRLWKSLLLTFVCLLTMYTIVSCTFLVTGVTGEHPNLQSVFVAWSFSFPQIPCSDTPWFVTSGEGIWGEGSRLLATGLESSRSHGNAAKGVEKMSDWSDGWRWGVLLCCRGNEAEGMSENWSRCWKEEIRNRKQWEWKTEGTQQVACCNFLNSIWLKINVN